VPPEKPGKPEKSWNSNVPKIPKFQSGKKVTGKWKKNQEKVKR